MKDTGIETILQAVRERGIGGDYRDLGSIYTKTRDNLILFNYSPLATYERRWNDVERVSRGLIINTETCQIVARPFDKFFNLGEVEETKPESLPAFDYDVTEKHDGSLGILYRHRGAYHIATRGSFDGPQALWATAHLQAGPYFLDQLPDQDITLLFEIIYPENRIVRDYADFAGLILIGARRMSNGCDLGYSFLEWFGRRCNFPVVQRFDHDLAACLSSRATAQGIEGWVIRYTNGLRVKIKTEEYLRLHRLVTGLNPQRVHEAMLLGDATWAEFVSGMPDEFRAQVDGWAQQIQIAVAERQQVIFDAYTDTVAAVGKAAPRGDFARHVVGHYPTIKSYLFAHLDGQDVRAMLLKNINAAEVCA